MCSPQQHPQVWITLRSDVCWADFGCVFCSPHPHPSTLQVTASDNSPQCFSSQVTYREQILDLPRQCSSRIAYHLQRTWNTSDGAGNVARAEQMITVMDVEVIAFPAATLNMARTSSTSYTCASLTPCPSSGTLGLLHSSTPTRRCSAPRQVGRMRTPSVLSTVLQGLQHLQHCT